MVINTCYNDEDLRIRCIKEIGKFRLKEGCFSNPFVQQLAKEQPAWKWWMMNAADSCPTLRPLAIKLLAQCASSKIGVHINISIARFATIDCLQIEPRS